MRKNLEVQDVEAACAAKAFPSNAAITHFDGVSIDGRKPNPKKLFFAIQGERFDAHDYLEQAAKSGATGFVLHREPAPAMKAQLLAQGPIFLVSDTLIALQKVAHAWRKKLGLKVIGIAGSNGKTSTKNFTATILSGQFRTFATQGNLNNHIGVPLTLLSLTSDHEAAVVEMGMNHTDELKLLTEIADPDVCFVTNVAHEHIEFFGTLEKIAEAEEEIYRFSRPGAVRVFNLDQQWTADMALRYREGKSFVFSSRPNDVASSLSNAKFACSLKEKLATLDHLVIVGNIGSSPGECRVPVFGRHQVQNLMAAAAIGMACEMQPEKIWKQLEKCTGEWGRGQILSLERGGGSATKIIFDAYNANLESAEALLENVSRLRVNGKRIGIFADMLELGSLSPMLHEKFGERVSVAGFDCVWFYGEQRESFERGLKKGGFHRRMYISSSYDTEILSEIGEALKDGDLVVLKGSRGMKMERVLESWHVAGFAHP